MSNVSERSPAERAKERKCIIVAEMGDELVRLSLFLRREKKRA